MSGLISIYNCVSNKNENFCSPLWGFGEGGGLGGWRWRGSSFLNSIGKVMEGNGFRTALEIVYTPVTANHMFNEKAYDRVVRGHLLCTSDVQLILLKEFIFY